jgi:dolichol-phosphate mannosyltransferase
MSLFFSLINFYNVTDVATCYKLMPASFFKNINLVEKGFSIEIELLSKYLKINRSIVEVPIMYEGRSYSEGKKIKTSDGFKYLFNTLRYRIFN